MLRGKQRRSGRGVCQALRHACAEVINGDLVEIRILHIA